MIKNQKYFFLYALIITLVVFNFGVFMGYMLESSRIEKVNKLYLESEMELLDQKIQKDALNLIDFDCDSLIEENIKFGDKIFQEALIIDRYEKANRINEGIIFQHKRFDLLRTLFWMNSIEIKNKCDSDYHNLVYIYQYNDPPISQKSKQKFFSNLLLEIKEKQGNKVMLIPIAGDNNISTINLILNKYDIEELPVILIDEEIKITDVGKIEDVEKYLE